LEHLFNHATHSAPELIYTHSSLDKGHGRLEHRTIYVLDTSKTELPIPDIQQIGRLVTTRETLKTGKTTSDITFLITNLSFDQLTAERFLHLKRRYWDIENKLHYRKDFVYGEDRSTIRAKYGPQNMATLRNFAIGLLSSLGIDNIKRCVDNLRIDPQTLINQPVFSQFPFAA